MFSQRRRRQKKKGKEEYVWKKENIWSTEEKEKEENIWRRFFFRGEKTNMKNVKNI